MGKIHSIESMGLVDGPGIRSVVFFQGCDLRCVYCHNPDTWDKTGGIEMSSDDIVKKIKRFKPYFKDSGGITISGGEPLLQKEFLLEILKKCKEEGIHTCIDTAGYGDGDFTEILEYTDLILFDIKHFEEDSYRKLVKGDIKKGIKFLDQAQRMGIPLWIRHVVVPEMTDSEEHIRGLGKYIKTLQNVEKVELLPFHQLGQNKYKELGIKYSLEGKAPMDKDKIGYLEDILREYIGEKIGG